MEHSPIFRGHYKTNFKIIKCKNTDFNPAIRGHFFLFIRSESTNPGGALTLEKIWTIAEKQNRQLKLSGLYVRESTISIQEAKDKLLPDLSVSGNYSLNSKFLIYDNGLLPKIQNVVLKLTRGNVPY